MNILGDNFVRLEGKITKKIVKNYNSSLLFRCSLAIPINNKFQYINISAWRELAEELSELPEGTYIRVYGHIETSSYTTNCKYCNGPLTNYWTVVGVDNFVVLRR